MQIFARLTKVNESDHTVEGVIASEAVDRSGEVFDYERSKPHFVEWSEGVAKATGGKNLGNVRVMHGNVVAGVTKSLEFDDNAKQITVKSQIVDENEWKKTLAGCYTGFSIGGRYVGDKWADAANKGVMRYEAKPHEYSLVDLPCNPDAQFTVVKSDGSEELRKFEFTTDDEALFKWADEHAEALEKIARRKDADPKEGEDKYGKDTKFADEKNKKYPIDTPEHIRAAWNYIHKGENADKYSADDAKAIKAKIVAAWKDKIDPKGPPEAEKAVSDAINQGDDAAISKSVGEGSASELHDFLDECEDDTEPDNDDALSALDDAHDAIGGDDEMAKGDFPGHPFRGNQYVGGGGSMAHHRASFRAHQASKATQGNGSSRESHLNAAAKHDRAARSAKRAGNDHKAEYHAAMAKYHTARAARFKKDAEVDLAKGADELAKLQADIGQRDELLAKAATRIEELTGIIEKMKAEPVAPKIAMTVVAKGDDVVPPDDAKVEKVLNADGSVNAVATALRESLRNPVMVR